MKKSDIVIVGGVAAGPKAAATVARRLPTASVTLFQKEEHLAYSSCGLPFFASGDLGSFRELTVTPYGIQRDADFFRNSKGFEAVTSAEVIGINRTDRVITVRRVAGGDVTEHGYDKLVLATGAVPVPPTFEVAQSERVRFFHNPGDAMAFRKLAEQSRIDRVAIIGGGFVGCELAEAAGSLWGIEVTLIEKENQLLPYVLDPEMAAIVRQELLSQNVTVITGGEVKKIGLDGAGSPVVSLYEQDAIAADYVFLALGVHPAVSLAEQCGLKIGPSGGIAVNRKMQTSDPHIYAGGDCAESVHQITGKRLHLAMGSLANRHGRVIAENLAGGDAEFPGVLGTFLLKIFDSSVGAVGLTLTEAEKAGFEAEAVWGTFPDKPDYQPDMKVFVLKMVYAKDTEQLLGLQATGPGDICRRLDVFASFLQRKATIGDLFDFEHGYTPPFSEALDPLHHMAGMARAQQKGMKFLSPDLELAAAQSDGLILLDVREYEEAAAKPLPESLTGDQITVAHIPSNELKSRLAELERDRRVIVICQRGSRSYQAALMLKAAGFAHVDILAGGLQALSC